MSLRWLALFALPVFVLGAEAADDTSKELSPPTKLLAGGKAIDVPGPAAPFYGDFKGDGSNYLLVGCGDGKLRLYKNNGSGTADHKFDNSTTFHDGKAGGVVPASGDVGFTPQLVKRDQGNELLSGCSAGELFAFQSKGKGTYGNGEHLKDKAGKAIRIAGASTVFAFDWRGTGRLDLLVGTIDGSVYLIPNDGTTSTDSFGAPKRLDADGKPIKVPMGHSHPVAADWDKNGKPDLIVGTGAGSVLLFRNTGSREDPKLSAAQTLVRESVLATNKDATLKDNQWGLLAKICVVDWNGDGKLDLLVGDTIAGKSQLTAGEKTAENKAKTDLDRARREFESASQKARNLEKAPAKENAQARTNRERELAELRTNITRMQREIQDAEKQLTNAEPKGANQYHGHIWLFRHK